MLSRFCNSSLNVMRLVHIVNISTYKSVPALLFAPQKSNYTSVAPNVKFNQSKSLQVMVEEMKKRVENKNRLSQSDLKMLCHKLKTQTVDSAQALEILRFCTFGRVDEHLSHVVDSIWTELKKQKIDFHVQHYNSLLQFARDRKDVKRAQTIFDELIANDIKPNVMSYQYLLSTYCLAGDIDKAIEILEMMDKDKLYINENTYNNLIQCHIICGNLEAADETIEAMKTSEFKLNFYTLEAFLNYYAKVGDCEGIAKTLETFKESKLEVLNRDILKVMCELAANGHVDKVDSMVPYLKSNIELRRSLQNIITTFVEKKQSVIVPKIIKLTDGDVKGKYKHLINEMIRLSSSEQELNETVEAIEANGFKLEENLDIFKSALESSSESIIRRLLIHMKASGMEITESTFEKLFQIAAKNGPDSVLNVLKFMCDDIKVKPQITFIRDNILPGLNGKEKPELAFAKLQTTSISNRNIIIVFVNDNLNSGNLKTAYDFLTSESCFYGTDLIKRPLIKGYSITGDVRNFVKIVRVIHDSFSHYNEYHRKDPDISADEIKTKQTEFLAEILRSAISQKQSDELLTKKLLQAFVDEGFSISQSNAEKIQKQLKVDDQTQIGRLLKQLSSGELQLKPINIAKGPRIMNRMSSIDLQNILEVKQAQGHSVALTEKQLFLAYIREGNIAEIEPMMAKAKFNVSNADYAQLIDLYTRNDDLDNALNLLKRVCAGNKSFKLDVIKVGKLVTLMLEKNRSFEEIEELLLAHRPTKLEHRIFIFEHLLDKLADNGDVEMVEKLYDTLKKFNYLETTVESSGPLIKACLVNGAYAKAVEKYEQMSKSDKLVPMTMVLFKELIKANEIDLLQNAFDIYEKLHGQSAALCRLAFAFVECGQARQAKAIFENEQIKEISKEIVRECKKFTEHGKLDATKALLEATQGIYCNRNAIYQALLDIYQKENNAQDALGLWIDISADGILPSQQFKNQLIELLTANNVELPLDLKTNRMTNANVTDKIATN